MFSSATANRTFLRTDNLDLINHYIKKNNNNNNRASWPVEGAELLTEGSCVCGLGEIFWYFPVDIESEERIE